MLQRFSKFYPSDPRDPQSGAVYILCAISLVGLLFAMGLALDAGNLYRARQAMQSSVDAATLSTVNYINEHIRDFPIDDADLMRQKLLPYAKQAVEANLAHTNYEHSAVRPVTVRVDYSVGPPTSSQLFRFQVSATRSVEYLLMGAIPGIGRNSSVVDVSAATVRKIANIALLLDASGSMACPAHGECTCLTASRQAPCPAEGRKFDELVDAVGEFIKLFHVGRDRLVFIPFNRAAETLSLDELVALLTANSMTVRHPITDQQINAIKAAIRQKIVPRDETNVCDAIMNGVEAIRSLTAEENFSVLLFSDGAPTAGRFLFSDVRAGQMTPWPTISTGQTAAGNYDYSQHSVEWVLPPSAATPNSYPTFPGPSLLYQTGLFSPLTPTNDTHAVLASCHGGQTTPPPVSSEAGINEVVTSLYQPCLNSMQFHMPHAPNQRYGGNYRIPLDGNQYFLEQFYNCAIALSDYVRDSKGTFYSIGYGPKSDVADPLDPYGNVFDSFSRKDLFNARLTADQESLSMLQPELAAETVPTFPFDGYRSFEEIHILRPDQQGKYLATGNIDEVRTLFKKMGRLILLRLVA